MGLISNLYFAFHFFFFFWFLDHAPQNISTYQNIYPREYGKTFKVVMFKKKILFSATGNWNVCNILGIRKAKGLLKTQFLIIFFTASNPNHIKTLGLFSNLIFAIYEKKMFLCTMHSVFYFAFGPCHLFRTILIFR